MTEHGGSADHDLTELRALLAQAEVPEGGWVPPPPELWERIEAATSEPDVVVAFERPRRRRRWAGIVLGAAAAVVAIVVAAIAVGDTGDDATVVTAVDLERLGESGAGRAELVEHDDTLQIRLQTEGLDPGDGYLELWLIDPTVSRLVSLGPLRDDGTYDLPAHLDPAAFPIVDVSIEPVDGNPAHSGNSVLRGELTL